MALPITTLPPPDLARSFSPVRLVLEAVRRHLGMEVAYVAEFVRDRSVLREVDAPGLGGLIKPGDSRALDEVYCRHILVGRLPQLMPDTADFPLARSMPITRALPVGAHVGVPLRLADGRAFGTFCCLSPHANRSLNHRDLQVVQSFAELTAQHLVRGRSLPEAEIERLAA